MELTLINAGLRVGDQLEIKGKIPSDVTRFQINLGSGPDDLALHFNPRFGRGATIVCNTRAAGSWGEEDIHPNRLEPGTHVKLVFKMTEELFRVELHPDGEEVIFPNNERVKVFSYVAVRDLKLDSFMIR